MCKDNYFVRILVMVFVRSYKNDLANENNKKMFSMNYVLVHLCYYRISETYALEGTSSLPPFFSRSSPACPNTKNECGFPAFM